MDKCCGVCAFHEYKHCTLIRKLGDFGKTVFPGFLPAKSWSWQAEHTSYTHSVQLCGSYTSHVTRHTSHVTRHTSHVTRHTSHVTCHTPHVTHHTSHITSELQPVRGVLPCGKCCMPRWYTCSKCHKKSQREVVSSTIWACRAALREHDPNRHER
jgi:hypothetical protein